MNRVIRITYKKMVLDIMISIDCSIAKNGRTCNGFVPPNL
jgi:hypothetical protein